jgi:hypothetical protein
MPIEITSADRGMIRYVLDHLREADARELAAVDSNLFRLPDVLMRHKVFAFCAYDYGLGPVAIWCMVQSRPGVGTGFAFGTEHWGRALLPMLHQIRHFVLPFLLQAGFHRVEAAAMAHRDDVGRFMELIGAEPEAVMRGYGTAREDFILYRWLSDEYRDTRSAQRAADQHATH